MTLVHVYVFYQKNVQGQASHAGFIVYTYTLKKIAP